MKDSFNCGFNSEPIEPWVTFPCNCLPILYPAQMKFEYLRGQVQKKKQFYERDRKNQVINFEFNSKSTAA